MLVQQQMSSNLPQRDMDIFAGDPLQFLSFIKAFEHHIEEKTSSYQDCLYFLEQYTKGQPKELVRSCLHMVPQQGYQKAKGLLKEHFGSEQKIASAYMDKIFGWPVIKTEDVQALQEFALFLRGCCNVMAEIQYMEELNIPSNMKHVIMRWPYKLRERWRSTACELQERRGLRATFPDMVNFLETQVKILSHPLFGDITDTQLTTSKTINKNKPPTRNAIKGSSFATNTSATIPNEALKATICKTSKQVDAYKESGLDFCLYCKRSHLLVQCPELIKVSQREKIEFLRGKGVCFGCLKVGHMSKECRNRLTCNECKLKHPTILHIYSKEMVTKPQEREISNALVSSQACGFTGAGDQYCALSIVPVQVKSKKGDKVLKTYAFLDPGSTATFCTSSLVKKLNLQGKKTNILLRTMGQENVVETQVIAGLELAKLEGSQFFALPEVYTQEDIPVSLSNIPVQQDLEDWDYLRGVKIPELDANVEILIGTNAPNLIEPWEIINSQGGGPYAVRTLLGWVINGPLRSKSGCCKRSGSTIYANRISIARLEELLISQYNQDFNEKSLEERQEMSRDDLRFMDILERSTYLQEGHYYMDLPFKTDNVTLPNNRCIVEQRLNCLKRKFERNKSYQEEYTMFISHMIDSKYAEVVPKDQLECEKGHVWYLPHHGVYHPRKKTLRVVFDCGAGFKGTSLNCNLLQGPDLTNSLFGVLTRFRLENIALMTDVQAMFHQVRVSERHVNFLRFLWWPAGDVTQSPLEHRMKVHIFGAVSSPSCANYALRKTATDNKDDFQVEVIETIYNNFYVDDCLKSLPSEEEAIKLATDLTEVCSKGGFQLLKWTSNSRAVLSYIPEAKRSKLTRQLHLEQDSLPLEMALGLNWCVESDTFTFKHAVEKRPHTRRGILSVVSSIYDPLGFLSPVTLQPKLLLQEMCKRKISWDEPIPHTFMQQWTGWLLELEKVSQIKVSRCIKPEGFGRLASVQLHHFADASSYGYGTVSYLRLTNQDDKVHVT
ncbi:Gag polyprotein [Labeo rohita]|uniref:Gag polyprotein n=1 Tax=Labeo rohita TaxID=84645 RepID=A0ABQ8MF79_LABRO|nr:Gag polyprotein [Labeo rohita]